MELTTRSIVVEKGVAFEESISSILALKLGIKIENSKAFGNDFGALNINAKVQLLCELSITPSDIKNLLRIFIEIRNKFAHVRAVNSFTYYFEQYPKDKKTFLNCLAPDEHTENIEETYLSAFQRLCITLSVFLTATLRVIADKQKSDGIKRALIEFVREIEEDNFDGKQFLDFWKKKIETISVDQQWLDIVEKVNKV